MGNGMIVAGLILVLCGALLALRAMDRRRDRAEWARLAARQPAAPARFHAGMIADLPEPARRYLGFAIRDGAPLLPVAEIEMTGLFSMGSKDRPGYRAMRARQILAAPEGFVWSMRTKGGMWLSGSDAAGWTRFRIFGLVPVARRSGGRDHARAAFGRCIAEAAFWTPAALLPGPGISWQAAGPDTARVTVRHGDLDQTVDLHLTAQGCPTAVIFQRWSDANPDKTFRLQPFGGKLSDIREVGGYRLPFHVEGGNLYGTGDYFPFFIARVGAIRFPGPRP